jgi:hypothetical protein
MILSKLSLICKLLKTEHNEMLYYSRTRMAFGMLCPRETRESMLST